MNKILSFLKNWIEKNGLIKILAAIIIIIISAIIIKNTDSYQIESVFNIIGLVAVFYLILTAIVLITVGIVNSFKK